MALYEDRLNFYLTFFIFYLYRFFFHYVRSNLLPLENTQYKLGFNLNFLDHYIFEKIRKIIKKYINN
jgi:hypothetical protein